MKKATKFKRIISGMLSAVMTVSAVPIVSAHAEENAEPYPYTMFAASSDDGAITVNAGNFCVNGNVATNGTIVSSGNVNVNGTKTESAEESMIFIFDRIDNRYFLASNVDEHDEDYILDEMNININVPTEVQGEATLTGNININNALKALEDVKLYGEVKNTNDSVIFSKYGDIIIESQNVNLNGLVYAPFGSVTIDAQNLNLNNVVIIAESIVLTCPSVNANYSNNVATFIGTESEPHDIPYSDWKYMPDKNNNGIPDYYENPNNIIGMRDTDGDFLPDVFEEVFQTDPLNRDTDGDGLEDFTELALFISSPILYDTDDNGVSDGDEDFDNDGLSNVEELMYYTGIILPDTDGDGLSDYDEIFVYFTDPTNIDTDGDTLSDCDEIELGFTSPLCFDTDNDGISDDKEKFLQEYIYKIDRDECAIKSIIVSASVDGNLKKTTHVESIMETDKLCAGVVGLVGEPFDNSTKSSFNEATITFTIDPEKLGDTKISDLLFLWYDEINRNFVELDTTYDETSSTVSTVTNHFSKYLIVDKHIWFDAWAVEFDYKKNPYIDDPQHDKNLKKICSVLAIDCSGSMEGIDNITTASGIDSLYESHFPKVCNRISSANGYIDLLSECDKIGIVLFEDTVNSDDITTITNDKLTLMLALQKIRNGGGTSFYNALKSSFELFSDEDFKDKNSVKKIILMSDGADNYPASTEAFLNTIYGQYSTDKRKNVIIDTIAFGQNANVTQLKKIANISGGHCFEVINSTDLVEQYSHMALEDVKNTIDITDTDKDGLYDVFEIAGIRLINGRIVYTNPLNPDSDGDGLLDGDEVLDLKYRVNEKEITLKNWNNDIVYDSDGNEIIYKKVAGICFDFTSYPDVLDSDGDGNIDSIDKSPMIPFDTGFIEVSDISYEPSIDFVNERYQNSQDCYNTYVGDCCWRDCIAFGVEMRVGIGLISVISAVTPLPGVFFGLKDESERDVFLARLNNIGTMPHASRALLHYISNSGEPLNYNKATTVEILSCATSSLEHLKHNVNRAMFYSYDKLLNDGTICFATKDSAEFKAICFDNKGDNCDCAHSYAKYSNEVHMDWQNTIGESLCGITAQTTKKNDHYTMKVRYFIKDIYEWAYHYDDEELSMILHSMHEAGFAQEYLLNGYIDFTIEWDQFPQIDDTDTMQQIAKQFVQNVIDAESFRKYNCFSKMGVTSFK